MVLELNTVLCLPFLEMFASGQRGQIPLCGSLAHANSAHKERLRGLSCRPVPLKTTSGPILCSKLVSTMLTYHYFVSEPLSIMLLRHPICRGNVADTEPSTACGSHWGVFVGVKGLISLNDTMTRRCHASLFLPMQPAASDAEEPS